LAKQSQVYHDILDIVRFFKQESSSQVRLLCHDHRDIPFAASISDVDFVYTGDVYSYLAMLRSASLCVSYRLHASLPCLSFSTPTIKISYDERALSLVDTVGLGEWNINMIQSDDVFDQVVDRYRRLDDLRRLRAEAQSTWNELYDINLGTIKSFVDNVVEYQQESLKHTDSATSCQNPTTISLPKQGPIIRVISA